MRKERDIQKEVVTSTENVPRDEFGEPDWNKSTVQKKTASAWIATHTNGRVLHLSQDDGWQVEVVQTDAPPPADAQPVRCSKCGELVANHNHYACPAPAQPAVPADVDDASNVDAIVKRCATHAKDCALYVAPDRGECDCHVTVCGADAAALIEQLARERDAHEKAGRFLYNATEKAIADREAAEARAREAEQDAERYRWLMQNDEFFSEAADLATDEPNLEIWANEVTAAIDAAREEGGSMSIPDEPEQPQCEHGVSEDCCCCDRDRLRSRLREATELLRSAREEFKEQLAYGEQEKRPVLRKQELRSIRGRLSDIDAFLAQDAIAAEINRGEGKE